jgi:predicted nicotinamide N-methyase
MAPLAIRKHRALLWRIHRRFATVTAPLRIGALDFSFTRVADPDRVLDEVAEAVDLQQRLTGQRESQIQHLPYWAEVWDSAAGIGQQLLEMQSQVAGRSVLDLGCGQGLAGCVAAALGADVLLADLEPPALLFAKLNSLQSAGRVRTRQLNWQTDHLDQTFDFILGADILYDRAQWTYLEPFWRRHLAKGGYVLLGEPGRQTGDRFGQWIESAGWNLRELEQAVPTRPRPIRIFQITKSTVDPSLPCESVRPNP